MTPKPWCTDFLLTSGPGRRQALGVQAVGQLPGLWREFRQGAGRLIRTRTDRGVITILDSRVLAKSYGRLFIEGLPQRSFVRLTRENRLEQFRPFT